MDLAAPASSGPQAREQTFRDQAAQEQAGKSAPDLAREAVRHHAPWMREYARSFRRRLNKNGRLLDIGIGYAWHWRQMGDGPAVVGVDLSLGNLLLAKRLLGKDPGSVFLVCADAAHLPFAGDCFDGAWSVQAFQHFPEPVFQRTLAELDRVLKKKFRMEMHHLNPALVYRFLCRLKGKRLHRRGPCGPFETNRLFLSEWLDRWKVFRNGRFKAAAGYSELFFHPDMGWRPKQAPVRLERFLSRQTPGLASLFSRQGYLRLENSEESS